MKYSLTPFTALLITMTVVAGTFYGCRAIGNLEVTTHDQKEEVSTENGGSSSPEFYF